MKFCTHCGAEIADDAVICVKCGCSVGKLLPKSQGSGYGLPRSFRFAPFPRQTSATVCRP
jgi:ribosomal protein L40E